MENPECCLDETEIQDLPVGLPHSGDEKGGRYWEDPFLRLKARIQMRSWLPHRGEPDQLKSLGMLGRHLTRPSSDLPHHKGN